MTPLELAAKIRERLDRYKSDAPMCSICAAVVALRAEVDAAEAMLRLVDRGKVEFGEQFDSTNERNAIDAIRRIARNLAIY